VRLSAASSCVFSAALAFFSWGEEREREKGRGRGENKRSEGLVQVRTAAGVLSEIVIITGRGERRKREKGVNIFQVSVFRAASFFP